MVVVTNRVCRILIAVLAVAGCLFIGTLPAQIWKLSIFGGLFPFVHLFDKLLVAMNTGGFNILPTIFAFGWLFKAHDLVEIGIETEGLRAASKVAFEYLWFTLHHVMAFVAC